MSDCKLWVDDIRRPTAEWIWAKTNTEAIRFLDTMIIHEVSIDHDISHQVMMEDTAHNSVISRPYPCNETFEPTARFLRLLCELGGRYTHRVKVTIHTANPAGAEKIKNILSTCSNLEIEVKIGSACNRWEEANGYSV